jgi:hypothetical protein
MLEHRSVAERIILKLILNLKGVRRINFVQDENRL